MRRVLLLTAMGMLLLLIFLGCGPSSAPEQPAASAPPPTEEVPQPSPADTPIPPSPTTQPTSTPAPAASPTPKATPTVASTPTPDRSGDLDYLRCLMDTVYPSAQDFIERQNVAFQNAAEDPMDFCSRWWTAGDLYGEAEALVLLHERCADPSYECLVKTRTLLELALEELSTSIGLVEQWCESGGNVLDFSALEEAPLHMATMNSFLDSATAELNECVDAITQ